MRGRAEEKKWEAIRCFRLGNINALLGDRYPEGTVPDDDGGRDDLYWLLLHISAGPHAYRKLPRTIGQWAPWMSQQGRQELIDHVNREPHLPSSQRLGQALGVTNAIRDRLRLWQIRACDMTPAQATRWRKEKARRRQRLLRGLRGAKSRAEYESNSISRTKPWELAGFKCRRTWERHGKPNGPAASCRKSVLNPVSQVRTR